MNFRFSFALPPVAPLTPALRGIPIRWTLPGATNYLAALSESGKVLLMRLLAKAPEGLQVNDHIVEPG